MTPAAPESGPTGTRRVLLVVDCLVGGGAERHVIDLAHGLRERGWEVDVACSCAYDQGDEGRRVEGALHAVGVPVHDLLGTLAKRRLSVRYAVRLRELVRASEFDLVHAHIYASEVAGALAVVGAAVPLVLTEHTEAPWRGTSARLASRWVYRQAAAIIAVSTAIGRKLRTEYGVPEERVRVVLPVGRGVGGQPGASPRSPELPAGSLVGFVGRLQPEKGVDVLLTAMAAVRREHPAARLAVVGDGPERPRLEELAHRLGIADAVVFLGLRSDAVRLLAGFDVLAVPSRTDGAPLVVHEGMAAGVAVVASATGGIVDRLRDGTAGVLVPPEDPDVLAAAIARLLGDDAHRRAVAEAGRLASSGVSFAGMLDEVEEVYASVLGGQPRWAARA